MAHRVESHILRRLQKEKRLSNARKNFLKRTLQMIVDMRKKHKLTDREILENLREHTQKDADFNELLGFNFETIPVEE
jgi:hypothetical protein